MRKNHLLILIGIALCMAFSGCGKQTSQKVSDAVPESMKEESSDTEEITQGDDKDRKRYFFRKPDVEILNGYGEVTSIGWYVSEFDADGNIIKATYYTNDTDVNSRVGILDNWEEYGYDSYGNTSKYIRYNPDGSIYYWKEFEFDADGNLVKYIEYNPDGSIKESGTPKYHY